MSIDLPRHSQCTADLPDRIGLTPVESDVKGDYFKLQSHCILNVSEEATAHLPNLLQARLQDYRHKISTDNSKLRSPNACYFLTAQQCISGEADPAVQSASLSTEQQPGICFALS